MSTITIGVDLGLTGAIAAISPGGALVFDLPIHATERRLDGRALIHLIRTLVDVRDVSAIVAEDVRVRPAMGGRPSSEGSLMVSRGILCAVADIGGWPVEWVQPTVWKRAYGLLKSEKDASRLRALDLFPGQAGELARKKDHNRAEALLMARWAHMRR